jgi:UDP-glucose 4-epimerase
MLIYNGVKSSIIKQNTKPVPKGFYADSKFQADISLQKMQSQNFNVVILRPPMIFGKNSKGNFPKLVKLAKKIPFFPNFKNERSMLYIENLCEFIRLSIDNNVHGVFFPQNPEYFCSSEIIKDISLIENKKIYFSRIFNPVLYTFRLFNKTFKKVFGDFIYDKEMSETFDKKYQIINNVESIKRSL